MILWTRRAVALATTSLVSISTSNDVLVQVPGTIDTTSQKTALFLGGFLLPASAYDPFRDPLANLGYAVQTLAYNDQLIKQNDYSPTPSKGIPSEILSKSPRLLLGHSKGAKTIAEWMPYWTETSATKYSTKSATRNFSPPAVVLIEPVDVVPPGAPPYSVLEEDWFPHLEAISRIPTLIVAAPYTDTSARYGKAKNLCAPPGRDAKAFFEVAYEARQKYPNHAAPLKFVEYEKLGHNDVVITSSQASAIGGCANGPDRAKGAQLVTECIVDFLSQNDTPVD